MIIARTVLLGVAVVLFSACALEPAGDDAASSSESLVCDGVSLRTCEQYGGGYACTKKWCSGGATPSSGASSATSEQQMRAVVSYALLHNAGASRGRCFRYVWSYLTSSGYGKLHSYYDAPDMPSAYARNFAEYMNANGNAARWGLHRLPIDNPYDAPAGAVVVVAAGSPGTSHPTAGDISIAAGGGRFVNDGPNMSYGGSRAAFTSGDGRVLGIYAPM
jgi:hypothetical protein